MTELNRLHVVLIKLVGRLVSWVIPTRWLVALAARDPDPQHRKIVKFYEPFATSWKPPKFVRLP